MKPSWLLLACALAACGESDRSLTGTRASGASAPASGPALTVPASELEQALTCSGDLAAAARDPVLLTPAFSTDRESFGWNSVSCPAMSDKDAYVHSPPGGRL